MKRGLWLGAALLASGLTACRQPAPPATPAAAAPTTAKQQVKVFVPCGMAGPYGELEQAFAQSAPDIKVQRRLGNYVSLRDEVAGGAKTDVLFNLGERELDPLIAQGLIRREDVVRLAVMPLALTAQPGNPLHLKGLDDLLRPDVKSIAVGDPKDLSMGAATKQALEKLGLWAKLEPKLIFSPKATFTMTEVAEKKVDASVAYRSCLGEVHQPGERPQDTNLTYVCDLPAELHDPIYCTASLVAGCAHEQAARVLLKFLAEDHAAIFSKWDYAPLRPAKGGAGQ